MLSLNQINKGLSDPKLAVMNFLNEVTGRYPNSISFAPGRPLEKNFEVEKSFNYINQYLEHKNIGGTSKYNHSSLGQYGNTKGIIADIICKLILNDQEIVAESENIVVTVGCQEAMCLCLLALAANPGDVVLVEDPAYVGLVGAAQLFGIEVVGVPTDENGIVIELLPSIFAQLKKANKTPRLLYTSPDFSNPTGCSISIERRKILLDVTRELGLIVLEDHAYSYFFYTESSVSCLKSLPGSEHVIYLGSFSKSIYPGVRIGFLVADQKIDLDGNIYCNLSDELSKIKSFLTVNSSQVNQAIVGGLIVSQGHSLMSFTQKLRNELKAQRDAMLNALAVYFPKSEPWCKNIAWNTPAGGFFITLTLPFNISDAELYECAGAYNVIWTPMSYFYIGQSLSNSIRLSFSYVTKEQIDNGIKSFSQFVKARDLKNRS